LQEHKQLHTPQRASPVFRNRSDDLATNEDHGRDSVSAYKCSQAHNNTDIFRTVLSTVKHAQLVLTLENGRILRLRLHSLRSTTSSVLARLPEVMNQAEPGDTYSVEYQAMMSRLNEFVMQEGPTMLAVEVYVYWSHCGRFDSRAYPQADENTLYSLELQLGCIKLGAILYDEVFAFLAKEEVVLCFPDVNNLDWVTLDKVALMHNLQPYTADILARYRRAVQASKSETAMTLFNQSHDIDHHTSWARIADGVDKPISYVFEPELQGSLPSFLFSPKLMLSSCSQDLRVASGALPIFQAQVYQTT
jgi:hypothetical protein